MGKLEDYTRNRMEGLAWALSVIDKEESVEQGGRKSTQRSTI